MVILDEPTEGLAPIIVKDIQERLRAIKQEGLTILLVEQSFHFATDLADQVYVLGKGRIRWTGSSPRSRPTRKCRGAGSACEASAPGLSRCA